MGPAGETERDMDSELNTWSLEPAERAALADALDDVEVEVEEELPAGPCDCPECAGAGE